MSDVTERQRAQEVVEDLASAERELLELHHRGAAITSAALGAGGAVETARRQVVSGREVDAVALIAALSEVEVEAAAVARSAASVSRLLRGLPVQLVVS